MVDLRSDGAHSPLHSAEAACREYATQISCQRRYLLAAFAKYWGELSPSLRKSTTPTCACSAGAGAAQRWQQASTSERALDSDNLCDINMLCVRRSGCDALGICEIAPQLKLKQCKWRRNVKPARLAAQQYICALCICVSQHPLHSCTRPRRQCL